MLRCQRQHRLRTYSQSCGGSGGLGVEGGRATYHGPYTMAHCLANGTAYEDYVYDS